LRLLAACLLAASGGLARQRLPDGSAPLSPLSDSSEPHHRAYSPYPLLGQFPSDSRSLSPSVLCIMASRPRIRVPSFPLFLSPPPLSLSLSLSLPYHPATFQCLSYISLSLILIGYPPPLNILFSSSTFYYHRTIFLFPSIATVRLSFSLPLDSPGVLSSRSRLLR